MQYIYFILSCVCCFFNLNLFTVTAFAAQDSANWASIESLLLEGARIKYTPQLPISLEDAQARLTRAQEIALNISELIMTESSRINERRRIANQELVNSRADHLKTQDKLINALQASISLQKTAKWHRLGNILAGATAITAGSWYFLQSIRTVFNARRALHDDPLINMYIGVPIDWVASISEDEHTANAMRIYYRHNNVSADEASLSPVIDALDERIRLLTDFISWQKSWLMHVEEADIRLAHQRLACLHIVREQLVVHAHCPDSNTCEKNLR